MIKRILVLLLIISTGLVLSINKPVKQTNEISNTYVTQLSTKSNILDQKIPIKITKDGNKITINHTSNISIEFAVVEFAYMENGTYVSRLNTFKVKNNIFEIAGRINVLAVKVHQVKTLVGNVYYTYATDNINSAGSFDGVERKAIVEIETTAIKTIKTDVLSSPKIGSPVLKYYEFYFDFLQEHDEVLNIEAIYIVQEYNFFGLLEGKKYNVTDNISTTENINLDGYLPQKLPGTVTPIFTPASGGSFKALETNKSDTPGTHVARVSVKTNWLKDNFKVENFSVIRIEYSLNDEFIIADVINDPSTPIDDKINDLKALLDKITKVVTNITEFMSKITTFLTGNASTFLKVALVITAIILYAIFSPIVKIIWRIIKLVFNTIIKILAGLFGWLF